MYNLIKELGWNIHVHNSSSISISKPPLSIFFPIITGIRRTDKTERQVVDEGRKEILENLQKIMESLDIYKSDLLELYNAINKKE